MLFVHGAYDHGRMFDELAPRVAGLGYHAVAVDLRGHGDSGPLGTGMAWELITLDLALLARHLGPPVGFVGHSFGGGQVGAVAGAFPDLVRWIVNLDGLGPPADGFAPRDPVAIGLRRSFDAIDRAGQPRRPWASIEEMAERRAANNPRLTPRWARHLAVHGSRPSSTGEGWEWKADPMFGVGVPSEFNVAMLEAELRSVSPPVLVLTGTEPDTWRDLSDEETRERVGWYPNARHIAVTGTGHYVHLEDPDAVVSAITAFLAEVGP